MFRKEGKHNYTWSMNRWFARKVPFDDVKKHRLLQMIHACLIYLSWGGNFSLNFLDFILCTVFCHFKHGSSKYHHSLDIGFFKYLLWPLIAQRPWFPFESFFSIQKTHSFFKVFYKWNAFSKTITFKGLFLWIWDGSWRCWKTWFRPARLSALYS